LKLKLASQKVETLKPNQRLKRIKESNVKLENVNAGSAGSAAEREVLAIIAPVTGIGRFSNTNKKYFVLK
jgi:hypothetical protein